MKPHFKSLLAGAVLASCALPVISSLQAQVVAVAPPAPVRLQYKVIAGGPAPDGRVIEEEVNRLAVQGWRVRTSIMTGVIMEKEL